MSLIKDNQSIFDLVTQFNGDVRSVVQWCLTNGYSITDTLEAGKEFKPVTSLFDNELVKDYYKNKGVELATADIDVEGRPVGVGYWFIENDFVVTST